MCFQQRIQPWHRGAVAWAQNLKENKALLLVKQIKVYRTTDAQLITLKNHFKILKFYNEEKTLRYDLPF